MPFAADTHLLSQLTAMGFPSVRCEKALRATGNSNADAAATWLFEHMDDADIDAPMVDDDDDAKDQPGDASSATAYADSDDPAAVSLAAQLAPYTAKVRVPSAADRVFKDEGLLSFASPDHRDGIYVCLEHFIGLSAASLDWYVERTGSRVFLHLRREVRLAKSDDDNDAAAAAIQESTTTAPAPTVLGIGVEGGFAADAKPVEYDDHNALVVHGTGVRVALPSDLLPGALRRAIDGVMQADSASKSDALASWVAEPLKVSKHAETLKQLDNGVKVPPTGLKCSRCELTQNLWLNLTDGTLLCGRKYADGSGGNGHALDFYNDTKYPLAVKLGTITAEGTADVYSYDEDDMVLVPRLAQYLEHWGINVASQVKTEKTMAELDLEANTRYEWSRLTESGSKLEAARGPGLTGVDNLGNSCYLNSVVQALFASEPMRARYCGDAARDIRAHADPLQGANDFTVQMSKLGEALVSGEYSVPSPVAVARGEADTTSQLGIRPRMFKTLVGKGHPEFSTVKQQDAAEFYQHLLTLIEREEHRVRSALPNPAQAYAYTVEERVECATSHAVRYAHHTDNILAVPIPMEAATNLVEVREYEEAKKAMTSTQTHTQNDEPVIPKVPHTACLAALAATETVPDFYSSAIKGRTSALKTTRLATMPRVLVLQLRRFYVAEDWTPRKLDVSVDMPLELDLENLRGTGLVEGETELPENEEGAGAAEAATAFVMDEAAVAQLASMGFAEEGCKRAVYATRTSGGGVEAAMQWVMEHMGDADFADPFVVPGSAAPASGAIPEPLIEQICALGFPRVRAIKALKSTGNNAERAVDWIFSHMDEPDDANDDDDDNNTNDNADVAGGDAAGCDDGKGLYRLRALISHMGKSTLVGHYVCHVRTTAQDGSDRWILFNDEKVEVSRAPPLDLAYLYVYERV